MMPKKNAEKLGLLIGLIAVGIIFLWAFVLQPLGVWVAGDWTWIIVGLGVVGFVGVVYVVKILPAKKEAYEAERAQALRAFYQRQEEEELRKTQIQKEEELKKSIIKKRIIKERANELEGLNLTEEEKNFQIGRWVKEAHEKEFFRSREGSKTQPMEKETEQEIEGVSPLSQREKEIAINKVGTKCCYPNCSERIALEVHHIIPRGEGGTNKESNLVVLCNNHHHLADRGAIPRDRLRMYSVARMKEQSFA
jgi:5-methylcytosine-specific restriction endonuclease McrA